VGERRLGKVAIDAIDVAGPISPDRPARVRRSGVDSRLFRHASEDDIADRRSGAASEHCIACAGLAARSRVSSAIELSDVTCSQPVFARSAGSVHNQRSKSTSDQCASRASDGLPQVAIMNISFAAPEGPVPARSRAWQRARNAAGASPIFSNAAEVRWAPFCASTGELSWRWRRREPPRFAPGSFARLPERSYLWRHATPRQYARP
jgi:hypothetical protein